MSGEHNVQLSGALRTLFAGRLIATVRALLAVLATIVVPNVPCVRATARKQLA